MASVSFMRDCEPISILSLRGNMKARAECAVCGVHHDWEVANRVPPERVRKHYSGLGWHIGRRLTCPDCMKKKEKPKMSVVPIAKPEPVAASTDAAKKNKRLVIVALEDYFDEATKRYRDSHDDDTVAKELGLAPGFVAMVREEFYGKMAEPDEVTALRGEVSKLMAAANAITTKLSDLAKRNGWAV